MELDLKQFFRDLLKRHHVVPHGHSGGPLSESEFEELVSNLAKHAKEFRKLIQY